MAQTRSLMQRNLITVSPDTPLRAAIGLLIRHRISGLPVVDGAGRLQGIVTEKDVMRVLYEPKGTFKQVGDLMVTEVRAFQADEDLSVVCDCLMANHFRRVLILEGDRLVGLISRADLMPVILDLADETLEGGS